MDYGAATLSPELDRLVPLPGHAQLENIISLITTHEIMQLLPCNAQGKVELCIRNAFLVGFVLAYLHPIRAHE